MIDVFEYFDYRKLLADRMDEIEGRGPGRSSANSFRTIAKKVGFDASFFCKIVKGKRNLSEDDAARLGEVLRFNREQRIYFDLLVKFNQARGRESQRFYFEKLLAMRKPPRAEPLAQDQFQYYSQWYNAVIREVLNFYPHMGDNRKLASMVVPAIKPSDARKAILLLQRLKIIVRKRKGYVLSAPFLTAGPKVKSAVIRNFQIAMIDLAKEAVERFPAERRHISGLTLSLSPDGYAEICEQVEELRKRCLEIAKSDKNVNGVYQVNLQAFPVSKVYSPENDDDDEDGE